MKKIKSSKIVVLLIAVYAPHVLADASLKIDQDLVIGNEPVVPVMALSGNTQYQLIDNQLNMQINHPVICNRIGNYQPVSNLHARITDPNGDNKGDDDPIESLMGIQSNVNYSVRKRQFDITSENRSKSICLSDVEFDVIFKTAFADEPVISNSDISYNFIGTPPGGYTPGSIMTFELTYENNSGSEQLLDFIEYHPYTNSVDAYFIPGGNISCQILDINNQPVIGSFCISANGVVSDATLQPTEKIRLSMQMQISASALVGSNLQMMAAVFPKVATIDSFGGGQSFSGFDKTIAIIPIVASN